MRTAAEWIDGQVQIPELLRAAPQVRPVLDRYGLKLIGLAATWQAALRDAQIHGFALLMILGVSQRILHHFYDLPMPSRRLSLAALVCLNCAVLGEILGLIFHAQGDLVGVGVWYVAVLVHAATVAVLVWNWRIFAPAGESDRSLKFLRAAYAWLLVSLTMLVLLPLHVRVLIPWLASGSEAAQMHFSHAYFGAIRHAVTVGFISLMIVGVSSRVVADALYPSSNSLQTPDRNVGCATVPEQRFPANPRPFVLLNVGCATVPEQRLPANPSCRNPLP